jgi:hypothetical protein
MQPLQRRAFLKSTLVAATCSLPAGAGLRAGGAAPARAPAAAQRPVSKVAGRAAGSSLQLSLSAYSFREQLSGPDPSMTLEGFIDFCAEHGLQGTELTE